MANGMRHSAGAAAAPAEAHVVHVESDAAHPTPDCQGLSMIIMTIGPVLGAFDGPRSGWLVAFLRMLIDTGFRHATSWRSSQAVGGTGRRAAARPRAVRIPPGRPLFLCPTPEGC